MAIDKFNGNLGNINNFLFGKKVEKDETAKTTEKKDVPVGKPEAATGAAKVDKTNLNLDANAIWGLHIAEKAKQVDFSDKAVEARAAQFFKTEPDVYSLKQGFGIPAEIEGLDEDIASLLPAKALAYIAKVPAEQAELIGRGTVDQYDKMIAMA